MSSTALADAGMRVLLITSRFPRPSWRGNQVRTVEWLEALSDHQTGLVCPVGDRPGIDVDDLAKTIETYPLRRSERLFGLLRATVSGRPLQEGLYDVKAARVAVRRALTASSWDVVVIQMVRCAWVADEVAKLAPSCAVVFDAIDAMGLHFSEAGPGFSPTLRPGLALEAARCRRRERFLIGRAAITAAVAQRDLDALGAPPDRARLVPVAAAEPTQATTDQARPIVLLSGNLGYRPTEAAARFFARLVWPEVLRAVPDAEWILAGARPSAEIKALGCLPGVTVHGDVPDLAVFRAMATVAVAPMASGSGVPMKVLEAWAAGVPVVAHPRAAEGLEMAGEPAVRQAATAEEWISEVVALLSDDGRATALADAGRRAWARTYHPDRVREAIRSAVFDSRR